MIDTDIDGLKEVNDTFGHDVGDDLLRRSAQILRDPARHDDVCVRLGRAEFALRR